MFDTIKIQLQYLLPKQALTCFAGWLAERKAKWFTKLIIKGFAKVYKVDMTEAEFPEAEQYHTFNHFFTRALKPGSRPIVAESNELALPVDGMISQLGQITQNKILQAKQHDYSLEALLACDKEMVKLFTEGQFITTYLSPKDYHRIHMPCDATLLEMLYVPGSLFSVNMLTSKRVPNLFARNERVICLFQTPFGPMAQILVGATIVGSIETTWAGTVTPPRKGILQRWSYPAEGSEAITFKKGDEMGRFKLGSTVINLFAANSVCFAQDLQSKSSVKMGELLAISAADISSLNKKEEKTDDE